MADDDPIPGNITGQKTGPAGWDWFEAVNDEHQKIRDRDSGLTKEDMARYYRQCFSTKAGQIVLQDLQQRMEIEAFNPMLGFFDGAAWGYWRSGANSTITFINRMVRAATQKG